MQVINKSKNTMLGDKISLADDFFSRLFGLIPKRKLAAGEGLIIKPCSSIHMFFMKFPIDVLFVDDNNEIVYLLENFRPWMVSKIVRGSRYVIELPAGTIKRTNTQVGDAIETSY